MKRPAEDTRAAALPALAGAVPSHAGAETRVASAALVAPQPG